MYLIVNNQQVFKFTEPFTIGFTDHCTVKIPCAISGVFAKIFLRDGILYLENQNLTTISYNDYSLNPWEVRRIENEDFFTIQQIYFQCYFQEDNVYIDQAIDNKILKIQVDIHTHVLDFLKQRGDLMTSDNKTLKKTITEQIEIKLSYLEIENILKHPFLKKSLKKILISDISDFENISLKTFISRLQSKLQLENSEDFNEQRERVDVLLNWAIQEIGEIDDEVFEQIIVEYFKSELLDIILGLGPLQELMYSNEINDIMVLPSGHIFVDRNGQIEDSGKKMLTSDVSLRIIDKIISEAGRRIDQTSPMVDARVADGSRLNAIIQPLAVGGPALTIRKFSDIIISLDKMVKGVRGKSPSLTESAARFLELCVLAKKNIIISGGTGSGKTTLINALSSLIPSGERIVIIEDTTEIKLDHKHIIQLQSRPANLEGKNEITIRQLVKNALRMRPDRIIIGECRSGETLDMLQAMNTGHEGSLTSVHANSPADAIRRIEVMSLEAEGIDLPSRAIREQIASAINLIVQINRFSDGRKISAISEVVEYDEETNAIIVEEIFKLRKVIKNDDGILIPVTELAFTGYIPGFIEDLIRVNRYRIDDIF